MLPSASLVPENDPTTLFTGSGMQPLVPYLLGKNHPAGTRLVNAQKCFRAMDIEEVGDNRHTTFFEMLGNWSFGDYFKKEQLTWFFEFLTKEVGIPAEKLWVTCFEGDVSLKLPKDDESAEIWKSLGIREDRIKFYGSEKNWWSRAGEPQNMPAGEPGGPDSEVFYDFGPSTSSGQTRHTKEYGDVCHPNCDCGRFMEIGNSVFMQYLKQPDGSFALLPKQNVDFGGGLERIAAASIQSPDVFATDAFLPLIQKIETASGKKYADNPRAFRIVADHVRAAEQLIADGILPGNSERSYVVRRLIRRAVRYADQLGMPNGSLASITGVPEIAKEEESFRKTLSRGMRELERFVQAGELTAESMFQMVTTYGFPFELLVEEAGARGIKQVDTEGFKELLKKHQDLSRAGSEQKFKGGLADQSAQTTRLHTAHHLLLKALQIVLGPGVKQRGSNITQERLRIDFSYPAKMTKEQIAEVEKIVNEKIKEDLPVVRTEMSLEDAEALEAEHEFGAKYPERVSVYSVGPLGSAFSIEFCGGPHVERTGELGGTFRIQKEEAVAAGIRRIKAVLTK